jgi:threonine/homoserine/homoserine lactone efflux protein
VADPSPRRALGALFLCLALAFAGVAAAAAQGHSSPVARWIVAVAAAALALWLGSLAWRAWRPD